jgi:hypothetical protein
MTTDIYFSKFEESINELEDTGITYFPYNGDAYQFIAEIDPYDDFVRIHDTLGRMLPIDKTSYRDMIEVMTMALGVSSMLEAHNRTGDFLSEMPTAIAI